MPPTIGHNRPALVDPKRLLEDYGEDRRTSEALLEKAIKLAAEPLSEALAADLTTLAKIASVHLAGVEEKRKVEKESYLEAGRTVDGFFKGVAHDAEEAKRECTRRLGEWIAAEKARQAEDWSKPPPEEAPKVQTDYGNTAFTRKGKLVVTVTDMEKVPRQYLMVNQDAVKAAIKGGMSATIPGIEWHYEDKVVVR